MYRKYCSNQLVIKLLFAIAFFLSISYLSFGQIHVRTHYNALVLEYDPSLGSSQDFMKVSQYYNLRNIDTLCKEYINAIRLASGGTVNWSVVRKVVLNEFPPANDPSSTFTPENYVSLHNQGFDYWNHGGPSYSGIINDIRFNIVNSVESGEIDAVWIFGLPGTGFWETAMAGNGAYWINGGPINGINCSKKFVIYGFGREPHQGVGYMLENTAHMIENIMGNRISPLWPKKWKIHVWNSFDLAYAGRSSNLVLRNDWQRFVLSDAVNYSPEYTSTGNAQVGTAHFPPGAIKNYGFTNFPQDFRFSTSFWNDGEWISENETYKHNGNSDAKSIWYDGSTPIIISDFVYEGDVTLTEGSSKSSHAGFLFRASQYGSGRNSGKGYYVGLNASDSTLILGKMNNEFIPLRIVPFAIRSNQCYHVKISAIDSLIAVFIDNDPVPVIRYADTSFTTGGLGVCTFETGATFDNLYANAYVKTFEKTWYNYPDLTGIATRMNTKDWDENHDYWFCWWYEHIPKKSGVHTDKDIVTNIETTGILNTWWPYIFDINQFSLSSYGSTQVVFPANYDDITVPSAPHLLMKGQVTQFSIPLFWSDAADNVGVTRYEVYRNDSLIQTTPLSNYTDKGFFPDSIYKYTVKARDGSGNVSEGVSIWIRAANRKQLVYNGTFEEGIGYKVFGWTFDVFNITNAVNYWDTCGTGINTSRSLHIHNTQMNDSRWNQEVTGLTPGTTYILKGYIKGKDIDPASAIGANLCISGTWNHTPGLTGTFDWTLVEMSFVAPSSGSVTISCRLGYWANVVSGKAWFDNISIIPVQPTIQAMGIQVKGVTDSSAVIKFIEGNGNKRIVFISEDDPSLPEPSVGESFEPDECFAKGDRFNYDWYCIANGVLADHEVSVSGLTGGCTYQVVILEYNGEAGSENYLISHGEDNPFMFNTPKRDQTIIINSVSNKTYGDPNFALPVQASSGLQVNLQSDDEDIASIENGMIHIVTSGICNISIKQPGNEHYNPADSITLNLVIGKALLTVQPNDTSRVYGSPNPDFNAYYKGFVNPDMISDLDELPLITTTATTESDVGAYPIVPAGGFDNNYSFDLVEGQLTVEKAKLWVVAADTSRKQGEVNPIFEIQIEGFVNDDDVNALATLPVAYCNANEQSEPGNYDIILSGGFARNYEIVHINGNLTIIGLTGVSPVISEGLQFYPNPAHSFIQIIKEEEKPYHVKISDISGRVIIDRDMFEPQVNIEKLTPGIYYVVLNNQTVKLIKY